MKAISLLIFLLFSCSHQSKTSNLIDDPLIAKQEKYRQCYLESNSYKGRTDESLGIVKVKFLINKEGQVKNATVTESDFKDPNFHACILDQIRQIKFDPLETETEVHQPISFIPVKS
jgi:TonB family protein